MSVSPWMTVMSSIVTPSSDATTCAIAVSLPLPGVVTPVSTVTLPVGSMRTVVVS